MGIVDMLLNSKRRVITFVGEGGDGQETGSIEVPRTFDISKAEIVTDNFAEGSCKISVPAMGQGIF